MTQTQLAEACGWDSAQARIGNYEKGRREPSLNDLRSLAAALNTTIEELLADDLGSYSQARLLQGDNEFIVINQYSAAGSAGNGHMNDHVEVNAGLAFKLAYLRKRGLSPHCLHVIYVYESSMETTISDGDVVLMDESQAEPMNNKIFVIRQDDGELLIKRFIKSLTGRWIIRSDNEDKRRFPDFELTQDDMAQLTILGRVVWRGGDL
ncbi:Phage repressor protein C, contains Cro/C1-type HTH and peptisase s24 domains [Aidingimonas halophila]|uniref:Phage repressor protein C, contains Cro/C1-type HTH and peptisase s24 domains n=2 Tax=Aidingimonas halophila TaxID=574349 RepID=A0A1H2RFU3_9GAMM|nr:hypothetical protein GCM10008094_06600 [Aidingimonas halophila]SDW18261.1 Phage repressor protein C, contains Cro/C1-type HTH and peptisase s24 domains [Aidingimonas halophila]